MEITGIVKDTVLESALMYAKKGLSVVPIAELGKRPILTDWVKECSTNPKTLTGWFSGVGKKNNIGIVTGRVSNILVIDVDTKGGEEDGRRSIAEKEAELDCYLPQTVSAMTQSGGLHLFFKYPAGQNKITGRIGILPQVDIRADGNQVVVYPSVGEKGEYTWIRSPMDTTFKKLPDAWVNFICGIETSSKIAIPKRPFKLPNTIDQGMRHATLLSYACSLANKKMSETEISGAIREANRTVCTTPIKDEVEIHNIIQWAMNQKDTDSIPDMAGLPIWVEVSARGNKSVTESIFVNWYRKENEILCINGLFYNDDGAVNSNSIKQEIQFLIAPYVSSGLNNKVNGLLDSLRNECFTAPPILQKDVINLDNTSIRIDESGISIIEPPFTLNRLRVTYSISNKAPIWKAFLNSLLEEEDILTLQEFLGYCLVPTTVAQKALFIIGKGGEGKSVIGTVMHHIFGNSMVQGELHKLQENRFMLAQLENKLVFYDDDLQSQALSDTGTFKKLVTATIPLLVERKGESHYEMLPYVKIIASGNKSIEACYDHSDGFYRRLLLLQCKPKGDRIDDKLLGDTIVKHELSAIVNWAIEGLKILIANKWEFDISTKSQAMVKDAEEDANTFLAFLRDTNSIEFKAESEASSIDIYDVYKRWCEDNAYTPLALRTVSHFLKENEPTFQIKYSKLVEGNKRGYKGIGLLHNIDRAGGFIVINNTNKKRG